MLSEALDGGLLPRPVSETSAPNTLDPSIPAPYFPHPCRQAGLMQRPDQTIQRPIIRPMLGFGLMVMASTAPSQLVLASQSRTGPGLIGLVAPYATLGATLGALLAAVATLHQAEATWVQAEEATASRQAEHLVPNTTCNTPPGPVTAIS